ncbi:chloride channel protein [Tsuneonella mangrovi]|uniref:chloride channel protein n=1 Tax=Tsuneonella mangrovi TaxID=1982042 RepID=UPI000BA2943D|nr:chloride channel protein [Tsuneonella mangrovi]
MPEEFVNPEDWGRRISTLVAAVLIGLTALGFAWAGDRSTAIFDNLQRAYPWVHFVLTPLLFTGIVWATVRFAPGSRGSGIPQVIAASHMPQGRAADALVSIRVALFKVVATFSALLGGASVGREGPTVQLAAALMVKVHEIFRVRVTSGVVIAGGAAGVAAAFNTPLAGIAFAIEELAVAYEQRVAVLVMGAVMIAGLTAQGLAGNYTYFGLIHGSLPITVVLVAAPLAGIIGGACGGLFARLLLALRGPKGRWADKVRARPVLAALICGLIVGAIGFLTTGATSGTGYAPTKLLLEMKIHGDYWFGPAKFVTALVTSVSGIPGGIFAPSLSVGAGIGNLLTPLFNSQYSGMIVLLGMAGYFTGVVRAPLTAVIILSEATGNSAAILPLFATALIGDWAGSMVCRDRLYHALAENFIPKHPVGDELEKASEGVNIATQDDSPEPKV